MTSSGRRRPLDTASVVTASRLLAVVDALTGRQGIAAGLAEATGADLCVLFASDDGLETVVDCFPPTAWSTGNEVALTRLSGEQAGPWAVTATTVGGTAGSLEAMLHEMGHACACEITLGEPEQPVGRIVLGTRDRGCVGIEGAEELSLLVQGLIPYIREHAQAAQLALRRQLQQTQKMESLGSMAGMVAHDFNNLLTTILGYTSLVKNSARLDAEDRDCLEQVEDAAHRAADLSGRLLSFARGGLVRFGPLDLRSVAWDALKLAEPTLHDAIEVEVALPDDPVPIEGDSGQLQQAILNVLLNARDAMPEGGHVRLALEAKGGRGQLTIADNGPGMDEETRMRIFEPFFTTKPVGSGSGLGMSITYGIVQGHNGEVVVETAPGKGSTFVLDLPLATIEAPSTPHGDLSAEGDLVLVVDDDEMVRRATSATVAHLGYNVVEASSGRLAIELVRSRPDRFSVVLLDLVMPELTGAETFRELQAIRDDLPVIVCTGYAPDSHIDTEMKRKIAGLVQKPFTPERLRQAITSVLV